MSESAKKALVIISILGLMAVVYFSSYSGTVKVDSKISTNSAEEASKQELIKFLSEWHVDEGKSEMDDSATFNVSKFSDTTFNNKFGEEKRTLLAVRCKEGGTEVLISPDEMLDNIYGDFDRVHIEYRFDNDKAVTERWSEAVSNVTFFAKNPKDFIRKMAEANSLTLRFTLYSGGVITTKFDVLKFREYAPKIAETCNWKL